MFKRYAPAWVILAVIAGLLFLRPWESEPRGLVSDRGVPEASVERAAPQTRTKDPGGHEVEKATTKKTKITVRERERYRRAIRQSIAERSAPDGVRAPGAPSAAGAGEGLKDRSGGQLSGLMKDLQEDLMPLADECYAQALERDPKLAGGLGLQFAIIGDEDIGGLVESVELEDDSDIQDPEMIECMRETLLSTIFPAPDDSGSTDVRLTLRFSPDEAE